MLTATLWNKHDIGRGLPWYIESSSTLSKFIWCIGECLTNVTAVQARLSSILFYSVKIFSSYLKHFFVILPTATEPHTGIQERHGY